MLSSTTFRGDPLFVLSKETDKTLYDLLLKSHYYFSVGFQLYDDVKDFKEDFEKGQFNWAIYKLREVVDFDSYKNDKIILNKLLYVKSVGQEILKESISAFQQALDILLPLNVNSEWSEIINETKKTIEGYLDVTNGYLEMIKVKIELSYEVLDFDSFFDFSSVTDNFVYKGLNYIKTDYLKKYAELKHVMYLSNQDDFKNDCQIHISDTFQRALLNCSLLSIARKYMLETSSYVDTEINYLIGRLNKDDIGGWSYFPSVNEISADIDDLGQMIQFFLRAENIPAVNKYCEQPIKIALSNKYNKHGGIATWILPNKLNAKQLKQDLFNRTKWGTGPDIEVVANFVYSLYLLDSSLYQENIKDALIFIKSSQEINGSWMSRWYYGCYYGTYVCLRLLQPFRTSCENEIKKALNYIVANQNNDGGFGLTPGVSDALNTSLAILSLKLFKETLSSDIIIQNAKQYLLDNQQQNGSWMATDFIKPKVQDPYKSTIMTTAFALEALI
jgi:Squalene cyclase